MLECFMFVFALCTDTFVASLAYGSNQVSVSLGKAVLLNGICSAFLGASLGFGVLLDLLVPETFTRGICVVSLFLLGLVKCLDYGIKAYINRTNRRSLACNLSFSLSGLRVIVSIYGDPMEADADGSKSLGWKETLFLAFAMSIDSLAAGTMAAFLGLSAAAVLVLSFVMGLCMMEAGLWMGKCVSARWKWDLSWLSGVFLMGMAVMKAR